MSAVTFMPETIQRELTFAEAIREALAEEMRRDPRVVILGEDVAEAGTPFKVLSGLVEEFGLNGCPIYFDLVGKEQRSATERIDATTRTEAPVPKWKTRETLED